MSTPTQSLLLHDWEIAYDRWAAFRPVPGETEDVSRYRLWLEWLALDLAGMKLVRHIEARGEIESDAVLVTLNADGVPVAFYAHQAVPIVHPARSTSTPRPRKERTLVA